MKAIYWIGLFLAGALAAGAQAVPSSFNYQGVLRGGSGELLAAGTYNVSFRLYTTATGGSAVWGRTYAVLLDTNGLFNVELTDSSGSIVVTGAVLTTTVSAHATLYVGLTVAGSTEIAPRQQLLAVPYALLAGDSKTASGDFTVTGTLRANAGGVAAGTWQVTTNLQVGDTASGVATLTMVGGALKVTPKIVSARVVKMVNDLSESLTLNSISAPSLRPIQLRCVSFRESVQSIVSSPSSRRCAYAETRRHHWRITFCSTG